MFINTSVFSYDLLKSSDTCKNSGNTETYTYYEEEEVVEESSAPVGTGEAINGETSVKKYICKYVWKVVCVVVCMGPDHQTYTDCYQECKRTLVNKSCRPYVE